MVVVELLPMVVVELDRYVVVEETDVGEKTTLSSHPASEPLLTLPSFVYAHLIVWLPDAME